MMEKHIKRDPLSSDDLAAGMCSESSVDVSHLQSILEEHDRTATYCDNDDRLRSGRSICNRILIMVNLLICSPLIIGILYALDAIGETMNLTFEQGDYGTFAYCLLVALPLGSLISVLGDRLMLTVIPSSKLTKHNPCGRYVPRFILTSSCCFCKQIVSTRSQLLRIALAHSIVLIGQTVGAATAFVMGMIILGEDTDDNGLLFVLVWFVCFAPFVLYHQLFRRLFLSPIDEDYQHAPTGEEETEMAAVV